MSRRPLCCLLSFCLVIFCLLTLVISFGSAVQAQSSNSELVQISPPTMRRAAPPTASSSIEELEKRGDELRLEKDYLDALDYYRAALTKNRNNPRLYNKAGIAELLMQRFAEAGKDFERAVHLDHEFADAVNNLGVIDYEAKKYRAALKQYEKALRLQPDSASFYSNMGAAYFGKREFEKAGEAYAKAMDLDPSIFDRISHNGISAQLPSPADRARYDYLIAKLCAKHDDREGSLQYLRRAMEEGYKGINDVYKDPEFAGLRSDTRFTELMATRPPAIPE
jgi:tetratricopeptide (TPR) repeat protein